MVTRVRIEAEGGTPDEVLQILHVAHERLTSDVPDSAATLMFGHRGEHGERPGWADAQAGECVIERYARDADGGPGHGAIVYKGRMVAHYARPEKLIKLTGHSDLPSGPYTRGKFDQVRLLHELTVPNLRTVMECAQGQKIWLHVNVADAGDAGSHADEANRRARAEAWGDPPGEFIVIVDRGLEPGKWFAGLGAPAVETPRALGAQGR